MNFTDSFTDVDIVKDIAPTSVAIKHVYPQTAREALGPDADNAQLLDAAVELMLLSKAEHDAEKLHRNAVRMAREKGAKDLVIKKPDLDDLLKSYWNRCGTYLGKRLPELFFDEINLRFSYFDETGESFPVNSGTRTLSHKDLSFVPHWLSTMANTWQVAVSVERDNTGTQQVDVVYHQRIDKRYETHFNAAMVRDTGSLAVLGIPIIERHAYPACFVSDRYRTLPTTNALIVTQFPKLKSYDPNFDVISYFEDLFRNGELPLAELSDVRRLLMLIAAPLLRLIAPGLLGVYWLNGPSGAGKDYLAVMVCEIWRNAVEGTADAVSFDIADVDDLELARKFFKGKGAIYARAKEAGKTKAMIVRLIQLAGTNKVTKRGLYQHEVVVDNIYVYLADSAEQLPDKKEISRRTVVIDVYPVDDSISLGSVLRKVLRHSASIIASLIRMVESEAPEYYLHQSDTDSRPTIPVALSRLFEVNLEQVAGRDFSSLWDAIVEYQEIMMEERWKLRNKALQRSGKKPKCEELLPSYSYAHFVETMSSEWEDGMRVGPRGYRTLLKEFQTHRVLRKSLDTEAGYKRVGRKMKYLPVEHNGVHYAFRFVGSDAQNFIFEPEIKFCTDCGYEPITPNLAQITRERDERIRREQEQKWAEKQSEEKEELLQYEENFENQLQAD